MAKQKTITRRALEINQGDTTPIYLFTLTAEEVSMVAEISRVSRDQGGVLIGYQRPEVKRHVTNIIEYLNGENPIFPHPLILALSPAIRFRNSRGPNVTDGFASAGTIEIDLPTNSRSKPAWIVDGQQRSLALARSRNRNFPVPISAFIADTVDKQRDQFIRINSSHPLPKGLVTELLPEVSVPISTRLSARKLPSTLVDLLNRDPKSPFHGIIRRASTPASERTKAVVTDTSLVRSLEESLNSPSGCLFAYRNIASGETDMDGIWGLLLLYWQTVKETFPEAWGRPPTQSRLMHGVGIRAMGRLMDRLMASVEPDSPEARERVRRDLHRLSRHCQWTSGEWEQLGGIKWNELQNVPKHIQVLSNHLVRLYIQARSE